MAKKISARKTDGDKKKTKKKVEPQHSFEDVLTELEKIVRQLEEGEKPLEDSLKLYERGVVALRTCHQILDKAEKRIQVIVEGSDGKPFFKEIDPPDGQTVRSGADDLVTEQWGEDISPDDTLVDENEEWDDEEDDGEDAVAKDKAETKKTSKKEDENQLWDN